MGCCRPGVVPDHHGGLSFDAREVETLREARRLGLLNEEATQKHGHPVIKMTAQGICRALNAEGICVLEHTKPSICKTFPFTVSEKGVPGRLTIVPACPHIEKILFNEPELIQHRERGFYIKTSDLLSRSEALREALPSAMKHFKITAVPEFIKLEAVFSNWLSDPKMGAHLKKIMVGLNIR